ncbi:Aurofusarin cluster transcription factor aurR2 [Cladobotryum mycophilum]|uniref:Aurofusarin cluster transcription factor aurR2 n=1 Tax=Cladobotryum mycophilum TaxID=491253 RepID=A0ABR0S9P0_9HYPO
MSTPQDRPRSSAGQVKLTRGHSCVACHQRKVKCDGKRPCSTCVKSSRAADCRSARPSSSRQSAVTDQTLLLRLRRYEHLLIANGIPLNGQPGEEEGTPSRDTMETDGDDGHMIIQRGHPRFVENVIWNRLGNELAEDLSELNEAGEAELSEDEDAVTPDNLIFGKPTMNNMSHLAPGVPQILRLWQAFLDNFNPLVKLFHAPTIQQVISDAVADPQRLNPSTEALLFSIYLCGATTLTNQECLTQLGESKPDLLRRFSAATQQSLVNAQFLKSTDVVVLQALTLYLLARRSYMNEQSIWLLAGLASRLAQTMGLHREHSLQRISPFEAEIRRRLWWQIVILDNRSAQVSGTMADGIFNDSGYTRRPLNVSDSDLSPFMGELPSEYDGPTEMLFCTIRFEVGEVMRQLTAVEKACKSNHASCMAQKEQVIDAFETKIEYLLKRCDPSIPLHLMSMLLGRSAVCQTRLSIWQTKYDNTKNIPQAERDGMFRLALKSLEYDSLTYSTKSLQPYLWHVVNNFPFQAFIHLLTDLFHRTHPEEISLAWTAINQAYEDHPELISDVHSPLCFAVGNLTLKAWEHQAAAPSPQSPRGERRLLALR